MENINNRYVYYTTEMTSSMDSTERSKISNYDWQTVQWTWDGNIISIDKNKEVEQDWDL